MMVNKILVMTGLLLALANNPAWSMNDDNEFAGFAVEAQKFLDSNSSCTHNHLDNDEDKRPLFDELPNDVQMRIFLLLCLKDLSLFSRTSTLYRKLLKTSEAHERLITPLVGNIITEKNNFRFRMIEFAPNTTRKKERASLNDHYLVELGAAMDLGSAIAMLLVAESSWQGPKWPSREFMRYGFYRQALMQKKPGTNEAWFDVTSDERSAICMGIAHMSLKNYLPDPKLPYDQLKRAVDILVCVTDASYFRYGGVAANAFGKLWNGNYDRSEKNSSNNTNSSNQAQKSRSKEEKKRDLLLIAKLLKHTHQLGIIPSELSNTFGALEDDIQMIPPQGISYQQIAHVFKDDKSLKKFLDQGGANILPDGN